jgi:hypothetical protein
LRPGSRRLPAAEGEIAEIEAVIVHLPALGCRPTFFCVSTVGEIEEALKKLPVKKARAVASWLQDYLDAQWARQIERDGAAGKLDKLAEQAQAHYRARRTKPLDEVIDHS